MKKSATSKSSAKIKEKILKMPKGKVFTASNFTKLGKKGTIDRTLSRLALKGQIRRIGPGIFDIPKEIPEFGKLSPSDTEVQKAIERKYGYKLQPMGAYVANVLGLSEQVPAKITYLTDGKSKTIKILTKEIKLKHATPKRMATGDTFVGLIFEALRYFGKERIEPEHINHLISITNKYSRQNLLRDMKYTPVWMHEYINEIVSGKRK